jgi:hypothetical protein
MPVWPRAGGSLVAYIRMDGAWISPSKALTLCAFGVHPPARQLDPIQERETERRRHVVNAFGAIA